MTKIATLTKETDKGLSTWTFCKCEIGYVAFGGITNRCKGFNTLAEMQDCMLNYASYGYSVERHTQSQKRKPVDRINIAKPVKVTQPSPVMPSEPVLEADEDTTAPRPTADSLVTVSLTDEELF
tara:strand:+ start:497 stop:868 length:372 start_codon:yes stop_codon:yes gene_type:complete